MVEENEYKQMICPRCSYKWLTKSRAVNITCSMCRKYFRQTDSGKTEEEIKGEQDGN